MPTSLGVVNFYAHASGLHVVFLLIYAKCESIYSSAVEMDFQNTFEI